MTNQIECKPYPLKAIVPYSEAKSFVISHYEKFLQEGDLTSSQRQEYLDQFGFFADHVETRLDNELADRQAGKPHANIGYHAPHMWQAAYDATNVASALLKNNLVPPNMAYETPRNGLMHDIEYLSQPSEQFPTFAHNIKIHVPKSIGRTIRLIREQGTPSFYTEEEQSMSLYVAALEIHGTHFASKEEMQFHKTNRTKMIEMFAQKFGYMSNYEAMKSAAEWMAKTSRLWDLWGQLLPPDYFDRLPDLKDEMNAATPKGNPPKGDEMIGITPAEQRQKLLGFIQYVALDDESVQSARTLFGENNQYETGLRQLIITQDKAA